MDNTIKVYKEEKELREKRLAAYAETIREKDRDVLWTQN